MNEVAALKITSLQRCIARAKQIHVAAGDSFTTDYDLQDAAILNIIRACETAIDLANMLVRKRRLGIPTESRDAFRLLAREGLIDRQQADSLAAMVGFRNIAVHQYDKLNLHIVESVIHSELDVLLQFSEAIRPRLDD